MPSIDEHQAKADQNETFVAYLIQAAAARADWMVTILYYAALHRIQGLLHHLGIPDAQTDRHYKIFDRLRHHPSLEAESQLRADYEQLQDDSRDARYLCRGFTLDQVQDLRGHEFARIKTRVNQLMV